MNYNRTILGGRLTRDPETRFSQSGTAVCAFSVAVNRREKRGDEWVDADPTFVDVTMFGKRGEAFGKHHSKGDPCFIEGELRLDRWQDKNTGENRQRLKVVAFSFEFVGGKRESNPGESYATAGASQGSGSGLGASDIDDTPF